MLNGPVEHACGTSHRTKNRWIQQFAASSLLIGFIAVWATIDSKEPFAYTDQFSESFRSSACTSHWKVTQNWRTQGLSLLQDSNRGGIYFEARTMGRWRSPDDFAVATWPVATDSFCLKFAVEIDNGRLQKYFEAGVAVVLCPKMPDQMTEQDLCIVIQVSYAGIGMAVWRGWFLSAEAQQVSQTTHDVNGLESVPWHMQYFRDVRLDFNIQRHHNDVVMSVTSNVLPEIKPWHVERCDLDAITGVLTVNQIVVQRVPVRDEHMGYPDFEIRGRVCDIEGYLELDPPPTVSSIEISREIADGTAEVLIEGKGLEAIDWVQVGPLPRQSVSSRSESHLKVPFANLELPDGTHHLSMGCDNRVWLADVPLTLGADSCHLAPIEVAEGDELELTIDASTEQIHGVKISDVTCEIISHNAVPGRLRVRVPKLALGSHLISIQLSDRIIELKSRVLVGRHPRLLWDETKRAELKSRFHDPNFTGYKNRILEAAKLGNHTLSLLLVAELADDLAARERLLDAIRKTCRKRGAVEFDAMQWAYVAIVYDTLFSKLSAADRDLMRGYLEFVLECYSLSHEDWFFLARHNPSNTVAISNTGGGLAALALLDTHPQAERLAKLARQRLTEFAQATIRRDGGYIEGTLYWDYAITSYLRFLTAWRNSGLASIADYSAGLEMMPNYVATILGGDKRMVTFNDTQPWITGLPTIAFLGNDYELPWLDHVVDYMVTYGDSGNSDATTAFLWRSSRQVKAEMPPLPTNSVLPISQLMTFRSSPIWNAGATLSISGTHGRMSHHRQADQGGLIYSSDGHPVLIDPGYYQPTADAHSVMIINGQGPKAGESSTLVEVASMGDTHFALFDLTDCYRVKKALPLENAPTHISRAFLMYGKEVLVVDQVECSSGNSANTLVEQIQLARKPRRLPGASRFIAHSTEVDSGTEIEIRFWGHGWLSSTVGPRSFDRSWIFQRMAEAGEIEWHSLKAEHSFQKEFTSIWCLTSPGSSLDVEFDENGRRIRCQFSDGEIVSLNRSESGWRCDALKRAQHGTRNTELVP